MIIILNGEKKSIKSSTISGLVKEQDINPTAIVVAVNGQVVHWSEHQKFKLKKNDKVKIIRSIGGGCAMCNVQ